MVNTVKNINRSHCKKYKTGRTVKNCKRGRTVKISKEARTVKKI